MSAPLKWLSSLEVVAGPGKWSFRGWNVWQPEHSPNLLYSKGIDSHAAAIPLLKVVVFERSSACTLQFTSAELLPLHNFQKWDCRCMWVYSFGIEEVWWMVFVGVFVSNVEGENFLHCGNTVKTRLSTSALSLEQSEYKTAYYLSECRSKYPRCSCKPWGSC